VRLPRDLSGCELATLLRRHFGYEVVRQTGSHLRLVLPAALGEDESAALTEDRSAALGVDALRRRLGDGLPAGATMTH